MKPTKDRLAEQFNRPPGVNISRKLQKIAVDIEASGNTQLTRLTILKKWFEKPRRLSSFGIFIADRASRQTRKATEDAPELFREVREILAGVDIFEPDIPRTDAINLHARLKALQNQHRDMKWASVRLIQNMNLFLAESGLQLYLWHGNSSAEGYRLAANYCEHYDPRYGNGLNGPSANRIREIADFVRAIEAHEEGGTQDLPQFVSQ